MKRKIFIVAAGFVISSHAHAQNNPAPGQDSSFSKPLDEVVVTANRLQQKQSTTGKVVSVINKEMLERSAGKTLSEIINTQAGVFINGGNNNLGTNPDFYFRGAGTGNVLVLIDGVPVSDPSQINNAYDLNSIQPGQIERIEILKGAQSTLWGSDAVAGVVNIITKKGGKKSFSPNLSLSYGSYGTFRGNAGFNGKTGGFSYNFNYSHTNSKGFSAAYDNVGNKNFDNDNFKQNNIQANLGYHFNNKLSANYTANYGKYKAGIDAAAFTDDNDARIENENLLNSFGLTYTKDKLKVSITQSIISSDRKIFDDSTDIGGFSTAPSAFYNKWARGNYEGSTAVTELVGNFGISNHFSIVGGVQRLSQRTTQSYKSVSNFGPFAANPLGDDSAKARNFSVYTSAVLLNIEGFNAEAGFRYNNHSIYGGNATYTANPSFNISENTTVFVNISSGYRIPSLYQLYSEYGNKELKPEKSNNYEMGVRWFSKNRRNSFRVVAFKRDIKNLIVFFTDLATFASKYINRDKQNDFGFELESSIGIGKTGSWTINATYVGGEGTVNDKKIPNLYRRPNLVLNTVLTIQPVKGLTLMPSFRFVGERDKGLFDPGPAKQPEYYNIDMYGSYDFSKNIRAFIDLRNITNQQYFDIAGYNSRRFNMMAGVVLNF